MTRLIINFGYPGTKKDANWYKNLMDFPKLIKFQGICWEWVSYNSVGNDYELFFAKIPTYDPNFYVDMPSFEEMFEFGGADRDKCCCGAAHTSFSFDHMRFCPKWVKW